MKMQIKVFDPVKEALSILSGFILCLLKNTVSQSHLEISKFLQTLEFLNPKHSYGHAVDKILTKPYLP